VRRPAFLVLLVVPLIVAGCTGGGGGDTAEIPVSAGQKLVLQPADLPQLFSRFDAGPQVGADAQPGPRQDPGRFGRVGGWKARYKRSGDASTAGPLVVESRADLFDSDGGARDDLDAYGEEFDAALAEADVKTLEIGELGDEALGIERLQSGSPGLRYYVLAWRVANATGSVNVSGVDGRLSLDEALKLARAQVARMRAQGT
jgi:hypothetical protein